MSYYVDDSIYCTWETRENSANWYGKVFSKDGYPVICGHGGSMWLCAGCAQLSLAYSQKEAERAAVDAEWPWPEVPAVAR